MLAHRGPLGGRSRARLRPVDTGTDGIRPAHEAAELLARRVRAAENITVVDGTVVGAFEGNQFPIVERSGRREVRPAAVVVAAGSYEVPLLFAGNDRPGVMLSDGVRRLLHIEKVVPGRSAVVVTNRASGYELAVELMEAGVQVRAVVDTRAESAPVPDAMRGIRVLRNGRVIKAIGWRRVRGVEVGHGGRRERIPCDLVCVAVGERPADELVLQLQYLHEGTTTAVTENWQPGEDFTGRLTDAVWVVGSAAGRDSGNLSDAYVIGGQAAEYAMSARLGTTDG